MPWSLEPSWIGFMAPVDFPKSLSVYRSKMSAICPSHASARHAVRLSPPIPAPSNGAKDDSAPALVEIHPEGELGLLIPTGAGDDFAGAPMVIGPSVLKMVDMSLSIVSSWQECSDVILNGMRTSITETAIRATTALRTSNCLRSLSMPPSITPDECRPSGCACDALPVVESSSDSEIGWSATPLLTARVSATSPLTPIQGLGTAAKPSHEPIVVARKPLIGTVAENVQAHGTGALNVDGCRINADEALVRPSIQRFDNTAYGKGLGAGVQDEPAAGRWPANVTLSHLPECEAVGTRKVKTGEAVNRNRSGEKPATVYGTYGTDERDVTYGEDGTETVIAYNCAPGCPVAELDRQSGELHSQDPRTRDAFAPRSGVIGFADGGQHYGDTGGASRFFYTAKASRAERNAGLDGFEERAAGVTQMRAPEEGDKEVYAFNHPPGIGQWLRERREIAGLTIKDVAAHFPSATGGLTGCIWNWENEANRPTVAQWRTLKEVIGFDDRYDEAMTTLVDVPREQTTLEGGPRSRARNNHPTVKPIDLMRWLVRLVTPPDGTVLDPFAGSGTTGCAAMLEGVDFIGIEREAEYVEIAKARIAWWAQHQGREADEVLAMTRKSEAMRDENQEALF